MISTTAALLRTDDAELFVADAVGDGEPLVLVHGAWTGQSTRALLAGRRPELVRSVVAHEPPAVALHPVPEMEALFESVRAQIEAGDAPGATRRFFEEAVLGRGGWSLMPEQVQAAAIGNARTFVDMLADPDWGALDTDAIAAYPGRILITSDDTGPDWLPHVARTVVRRIEAPVQVIHGAGHTPHHTHPEAFAAAIIG